MTKTTETTETKATIDPTTKTDSVIAAGYATANTNLDKLEAVIHGLKLQTKVQADAAASIIEERQREQEKLLYDMARKRQEVEDGYRREDEQRASTHNARQQAARDAEDELLSTLKVSRDPEGKIPTTKIIIVAYAARIAEAEKAGSDRAFGIAKKDYETAKKIDDANAATASALLNQENQQLKRENTSLVAQCNSLLAQQAKVANDMKELGLGAFQASGGLQGRAVDSLTAAATAGSTPRKN